MNRGSTNAISWRNSICCASGRNSSNLLKGTKMLFITLLGERIISMSYKRSRIWVFYCSMSCSKLPVYNEIWRFELSWLMNALKRKDRFLVIQSKLSRGGIAVSTILIKATFLANACPPPFLIDRQRCIPFFMTLLGIDNSLNFNLFIKSLMGMRNFSL